MGVVGLPDAASGLIRATRGLRFEVAAVATAQASSHFGHAGARCGLRPCPGYVPHVP